MRLAVSGSFDFVIAKNAITSLRMTVVRSFKVLFVRIAWRDRIWSCAGREGSRWAWDGWFE